MKKILLPNAFLIFRNCLLFSIALIGCSENEYVEYFTRDSFINKTFLYGEEIEIKTTKVLNPLRLTVVRDSILLIQNRNPTDFYVDIYNIKSQKMIASIVPKGKGPDEFLRGDEVIYNHYDEYFWVNDKVLWRITRYNIDSVLHLGINYKPIHFRGSNYAKGITEFDDQYFVYFNKYYLNDKQYSNENINRISKKKKIPYKQEDSEAYDWINYPANVTGAYVFTSQNKDNIFVSYYYEDRIDIFNKELKLIKTLIGPDKLKPIYARSPGKQELILFAENKYWRAYHEGFYTDEAIYLVYHCVDGEYTNEVEYSQCEIFKISWEGKLLHHYVLDDFVHIITIDSKNKFIYGNKLESFADLPKLVRFSLE